MLFNVKSNYSLPLPPRSLFSFQLLINVMDIADYDQIKITPSINYMDSIGEGEEEKRPILQELLIHNCNCAARLLLNDD